MTAHDELNQGFDDAIGYPLKGLPFFLNNNPLFLMATENELVSMYVCARSGQHSHKQREREKEMDKCAHFKRGAGLVAYSG